jgi:hypothetical protein
MSYHPVTITKDEFSSAQPTTEEDCWMLYLELISLYMKHTQLKMRGGSEPDALTTSKSQWEYSKQFMEHMDASIKDRARRQACLFYGVSTVAIDERVEINKLDDALSKEGAL